MSLRDILKQQNEAQQAEREAQRLQEQVEAIESIRIEPPPLKDVEKDFIELYVKSVLILRTEVPPEYPDPEEEKKQLRLFGRSLGISRETQTELEEEVSLYDDQAKMETMNALSSRCDADVMTCFMCDVARLHGSGYKFEGDFGDVWRNIGVGIAKLGDEQLAGTEKFCRDIASGKRLADPKDYDSIPAEILIPYFGQKAFAPAGGRTNGDGQYLVIDLSGGPGAAEYSARWTDDAPDLSGDACRTAELWLRRIPAGTFTMGEGSEAHNVTISQDYFTGVFPVTQRQWELVMGSTPSLFTAAGPGAPVEQVSYDDICGENRPWPKKKNADVTADSFLGKLRARTGLTGFDLPTEAQWEYACRAGTTTDLNSGKNLTSKGGVCSNLDEVGWYGKNSGKTTHAVGGKRPNAWGLYDMHGNVWEWCRDRYGDYPDGGVTDPTGPASGSFRVVRGGCWCNPAWYCRSADRDGVGPCNRDCYLGFRLALVPVQ